jgi:hypothetical protein
VDEQQQQQQSSATNSTSNFDTIASRKQSYAVEMLLEQDEDMEEEEDNENVSALRSRMPITLPNYDSEDFNT